MLSLSASSPFSKVTETLTMAPKKSPSSSKKTPSSSKKRTRATSAEKKKGIEIEKPSPPPSTMKKPRATRAEKGKDPAEEIPTKFDPSPPNPKHYKKNWARTNTDLGRWLDFYSNKEVSFCQAVDIEFVAASPMASMIRLRESAAIRLMILPATAFPRMVRLFYLNMQVRRDRDKVFLDSNIDGHNFTLDSELLNHVIELPSVDTTNYPTRTECAQMAKSVFFKEFDPTSKKHPTQAQLKSEAKVIHALIVRCILPRNSSREFLSDQTLEILWLIMSGRQLDLATLILNFMVHAQKSGRTSSLPYANLLTIIFIFLKFDFVGEEMITDNSVFNEASINKLGIFRIGNGEEEEWKSKDELTPEEIATIPALKNRPSSSFPDPIPQWAITKLENRMSEMEWELDTLRSEMIDQHTDVCSRLDKNFEMLAILNSKMNNNFCINSLTFTATGNILPLEEDSALHARERASNVMRECERRVRDRPLVRPNVEEPQIISVETYGILKKYRQAEKDRLRMQDVTQADRTVCATQNRRKKAAVAHASGENNSDWEEEE